MLSIIAKLNVILKSECEKGVRRIPPEEFPPAISPNQISPGEFPPPPETFWERLQWMCKRFQIDEQKNF